MRIPPTRTPMEENTTSTSLESSGLEERSCQRERPARIMPAPSRDEGDRSTLIIATGALRVAALARVCMGLMPCRFRGASRELNETEDSAVEGHLEQEVLRVTPDGAILIAPIVTSPGTEAMLRAPLQLGGATTGAERLDIQRTYGSNT
mmetsp:Transcript_22735/g.63142  ORF Transcript_22735/g.63142 Transcript_22735/m.63142 type:complete len:149 (-) Transcript_22735:304-750(-)